MGYVSRFGSLVLVSLLTSGLTIAILASTRALALPGSAPSGATLGTAITYQGLLTDGGGLAAGSYDFQFILYDAAVGGSQVGPIVNRSAVSVTGGQFTTLLDFGAVFGAGQLFLDVSVKAAGGSTFASIGPRQSVSPAPQALYAVQAGIAQNAASVPYAGVVFPPGYQLFSTSPVPPTGFAAGPILYPGSNSWSTKAWMITLRSSLGLAAAPNGKVYAVGGNTGLPVANVEEYDPATNSWALRAPMPTPRYGLGLAAANGKLYAVGGFSGTNLATVEEYDPALNSWATKAPMPTARRELGLATVNGKLYAVGGFNGVTPLATVEEYDPSTNGWTPKAPMPTPRHQFGLAAASGKLYAVGGFNGVVELATVEEFDPATNAWTTKTQMSTPRLGLGLAAAANGKLYAVGGASGSNLATVEEYDLATNTWTGKTPLTIARAYLGLTQAANGKLYAVGGSGLVVIPIVEEYDPQFLLYSYVKQ